VAEFTTRTGFVYNVASWQAVAGWKRKP